PDRRLLRLAGRVPGRRADRGRDARPDPRGDPGPDQGARRGLMLRATVKGILAQKLRLLLTGLAIVIGVGFIAGTDVFSDTMNKAFDNLFAGIYSKTDVVVEGASIVSDEDRPSFPEDVLDRVRAVDGVRAAAGGVEGTAQLIKPDGDAVSTGGGPAQGFSWDTEEAVN